VSQASDLLAAGTLILAVLAVLYSIWYPNVQAKLALTLPLQYEDARPALAEINHVRTQQTRPLFLASLAATLMFLPKAVGVVRGAVEDIVDHGLHAISDYEPIEATFVFVVVFTAFLAVQVLGLSKQLRTKHGERKPGTALPPPAPPVAS
jgi:hypothetical protein